jgi:hypothetical protein
MADIVLASINAKWIHPSLALRLLKANLGSLEKRCEIFEFALRQPLAEKTAPLIAALAAPPGHTRILGISVSIWNHLATVELLKELEKYWQTGQRPVVVLGGPEVSHLPMQAEIFHYADYVIRGDGEIAFRTLCEKILTGGKDFISVPHGGQPLFVNAESSGVKEIKSAYHLYTDEDLTKKLVYVEASRGCPFNCEFCMSAVKGACDAVREFPLEQFLKNMEELVRRGAGTFKFLDRTFNINIERAVCIMEFFLEKIKEKKRGIVVHFEMAASLFPPELRETLARFPAGTLRLEVGIQTLNPEVSARIGRISNPEKELEALRFLKEKTNAVIHADLIAGLPGESLVSFGNGFDQLAACLLNGALPESEKTPVQMHTRAEIQLGILKLLPGAPIFRHNETFKMRYNSLPPYEIEETSEMSAHDLKRIKNFARFWEIIVNRSLVNYGDNKPVFERFMNLSDALLSHFGRNWGIDKNELLSALQRYRM